MPAPERISTVDRRGEVVALAGGLISLTAALVLALLAIWSQHTAASLWMASFQLLGAMAVWMLTGIQLHQQRLLAEERLEVSLLERERREKLGGATTIFDEEELDQMERLSMGRRLRAIERFLVPTLAIGLALLLIIAGLSVFPWSKTWVFPRQFPPLVGVPAGPVIHDRALLFFAGGIAFVCFMFSRYALGLSRLREWTLLRAGGNAMFAASAINLAIAVAILCQISGFGAAEQYLAYTIGVFLVVLGVETILVYVLDFYRPRLPGQVHRPFYDSRMVGIFSEPGGVFRRLARDVDYQFGFKVSETWFYKFLGQSLATLLIIQLIIILVLTCIVVVPPGHQAVITRKGRLVAQTAKPGIHFTLPWPIDKAAIIPVERIQRIEVGYEQAVGDAPEQQSSGPILWTKRHYKKEYLLLVADRAVGAPGKVPVNLLSMNMPVQWRVKDTDAEVIRFYSQTEEAPKILESLAFRELTRYAAQADILDLLGSGGIRAAEALQSKIQEAVDRAGTDGKGLGIQIVNVGIGGVHPPPDGDVSKAYEEVVSAYETRDAKINEALGDAASIRIAAGGSEWKNLYNAILAEDKARKDVAPDAAEKTAEVEKLFRKVAGGDAREDVAEAQIRIVSRVYGEQSSAERYADQLLAYEAAPRTYKLRAYLRMLADGLKDVRKYVVVMQDSSKVVYDLDLKPPSQMDILGAEQAAVEAKPLP